MEQKIPLNSITKNPLDRFADIQPTYPWIRYAVAGAAVASIFGVIILVLMLFIPISMLVIGVRYRDFLFCPIEPRISQFLIVGGSISLIWIILTIVLSLLTMFVAYTRSMISLMGVGILSLIILIGQLFLMIWLIVGSVWTFSIRNRVEFIINYPFNFRFYCQKTLYHFTFAYLIMIYIFIGLQICCRGFTIAYRLRQKK